MTPSFNLSETLVAKLGNAFLLCRDDARLPAGADHPMGLYLDDCRRLSVHELTIAGAPPRALAGMEASGNRLVHELTNPELEIGGDVLPEQSLRLRVELELVDDRTMVERIELSSHRPRPLMLPLELTVGADFRTIFELRGLVEGGAEPLAAVAAEGSVALRGRALDGQAMTTIVRGDRAPDVVEAGGDVARLRFDLDVAPGRAARLRLTFALAEGTRAPEAATSSPRQPVTPRDRPEPTTVRSGAELFDRILGRSLLDLRMLRSSIDGLEYCSAGIPWYAALFGRDSLIAAHQTLAFDPSLAAGTLRLLAGRLGSRLDDEHDEEPGKVVHELRAGPVARADASPLARYYGTVDATPLFLCVLGEHADWSGDLSLFRELRPEVDAALRWIDDHGDTDGDGLLDYRARSPAGLVNQGWKDSGDGVPAAAGDPLAPPVALVEVQGYAIRAKRAIAGLLEADGETESAARLRAEAAALESRLERLWSAERGHYGLAVDGSGALSPVLASNQGHLLWAGAVTPERASAIRESLMGPAMHSGWGIRTLAATEAAFNPVGYHLGAVWPHDNALIAVGLRDYGFDSDFRRLFEGLLDAASRFPGYRLPELFAGLDRSPGEDPVPYPVACRPQAWAAGTLPYLLQAGLGLAPDGLGRRLAVRRPWLPRWTSRLELRGLRVGAASVDLVFERAGDDAEAPAVVADARVDGDLEISVEEGSR